jgi:hypothetical protein
MEASLEFPIHFLKIYTYLLAILAYEMTLDGEMDDAQTPSTMENVANHQETSG